MSAVARRPRPAARILLLDGRARILLFRFTAPDRPPFWCTPGGAVDPGESFEAAAARELAEETGLALPCGPQVERRRVEFVALDGVPVAADERYFLIRAGDVAIDTAGHTALERSVMREWRWFDPEGLATLDELFFPEDLADLLARLGVWQARARLADPDRLA